jgi:hypothetical protein
MGETQSKISNENHKDNNNGNNNNNNNDNVSSPYTLSSIPTKKQQQQLQLQQQKQQQQQQQNKNSIIKTNSNKVGNEKVKEEEEENEVKNKNEELNFEELNKNEIITISTANDNEELLNKFDSKNQLNQLYQLPTFTPLIKGSTEPTSKLSSLFKFGTSSSKKGSRNVPFNDISLKELDKIECRSLIDILAEFQTYALHQNKAIQLRQDQVLKTLKQTQVESGKTNELMRETNDDLKKVSSDLRDGKFFSFYHSFIN